MLVPLKVAMVLIGAFGVVAIDPKLAPFCKDATWFDSYLRNNGFVPDDTLIFKNGTVITRYRFMGDTLFLAVTPDGKGCLLPMGMLQQPPRP